MSGSLQAVRVAMCGQTLTINYDIHDMKFFIILLDHYINIITDN